MSDTIIPQPIYVAEAADGDALIMVYGLGLIEGDQIIVAVNGLSISIEQDGVIRMTSTLPLSGCDAMRSAPTIRLQELYQDTTGDENLDRFVIHERIVLRDSAMASAN